MSPEKRRDFESQWPGLSRRLHGFLARKGVPAEKRDDLIQEIAVRLVSVWDRVDRRRSAWPLTVTIALNLLCDEARTRAFREVFGELPADLIDRHDVENAGIARAELKRVRKAMDELTEPQRAALLNEIGIGDLTNGTDAEKMLRLRARRKLQTLLEKVSTIFVARFRRVAESVQGAIAAGDGIAQGAICVVCIIVGVTTGVVPIPPTSNGPAAPRTVAIVGGSGIANTEILAPTRTAPATSPAAASSTRTSSEQNGKDGTRGPGKPQPRVVDPTDAAPSLPSVPLPVGDGDQPVPPPEVPDGDSIEVDDPPPVPDAPQAPDVPALPVPDAPDGPSLPIP